MTASTNPARGMRDFLPVDVRRREYVIGIIKEVYESYGFEPLETPAVENLETLTGKYGEEGNQLIYKILKRGEKLGESFSGEKDLSDLALRYDLTVPLARVVANNRNELPKFFKRYQIQAVWRADRPARGRFREFYQCDVDAIGSKSMIVEAELISAVSEILQKLGFDDFEIRLNNRKVLTSILDVHIPQDKHIDALIVLDKLDKIGNEGVFKELIQRGIKENAAKRLLEFLDFLENYYKREADDYNTPQRRRDAWNKVLVTALSERLKDQETGKIGLKEIESILELSKTTSSSGSVKFDISLARGLSYYTGAIFEINVPDLAGSLGGGGRYDGLIGMFGKEEIPACGFSLGLERILVVMNERGMFPPELETNSADLLVTVWSEETVGESLRLANELRQQGLRVLVYPEAEKLGKQFKYASAINVPFVAVLGDDERASGMVALKNLQTGEQETISRDEVSERVKR